MANNKFVADVRKIKDLVPTPKNYRTISNNQERKLLKSINDYDLAQPIVLNSDNKIIDGNFRVKLLLENGDIEREIPVMVSTSLLLDKACEDLALKLNSIKGEYDIEKLLGEVPYDLLLESGLEESILKFEEENLTTENDDDKLEKVDPTKEVISKLGEIYEITGEGFSGILGCGSSNDENFFKEVVGNRKIDLCFSDPNYNIGFDYNGGFGKKSNYGGSVDDAKSDSEYENTIEKNIQNVLSIANPDTHFFYFHDPRYTGMFQNIYARNKIEYKRTMLWLKGQFNPTPNNAFNRFYEPAIYGTTGKPHISDNNKNLTEILNKEIASDGSSLDDILDMIDIWLVKRIPGSEMEHPTQKPVTLYERPIKRCTKIGQTVIDTYSGSGSCLIACAQLKRNFIGFDINPVFVDLIITRLKLIPKVTVTKIK